MQMSFVDFFQLLIILILTGWGITELVMWLMRRW